MRFEKNGYAIYIEGTWCEISNRYGVVESGDIEVSGELSEEFCESKLDKFIAQHTVKDNFRAEDDGNIKRVAFDPEKREYIQLQAVKYFGDDDYWIVQKYDNELVFMGEDFSGCKYRDELLDWMRTNYQVQKGLTAEVFKNPLGDCTNDGISSKAKELYILGNNPGPFEPYDIRQCVLVEKREIIGEVYVNCRPAYCPKRWYMAGGNFLHTSDSRMKEITGISYPISIHDRYEGR